MQVPELVERALVDEPALAEDPDAVAQRLDLAQDVRREEHRLPACLRLVHRLAERDLHQRVEAARGLVEHEQIGTRRERVHELDLLAVALRQRPHLLRRLHMEAIEQHRAVLGVDAAVHPAEEVERLFRGERRPERGLARDVRDPAVRGNRIAPRVDAEQRRRARGRPVQAEQAADRRGLARAVGPEESVDLAGRDAKVETVERERARSVLSDRSTRRRPLS